MVQRVPTMHGVLVDVRLVATCALNCASARRIISSQSQAKATAHINSSRAYLEKLNKDTEKKRLLGM
jgi:hypothetical protein